MIIRSTLALTFVQDNLATISQLAHSNISHQPMANSTDSGPHLSMLRPCLELILLNLLRPLVRLPILLDTTVVIAMSQHPSRRSIIKLFIDRKEYGYAFQIY